MSTKISILSVISDHTKTFKDASTGKVSKLDIFTFLIVPIFLAGLSIYAKTSLTADSNSLLMNFAAIFTALLVSVLVLIFDQTEKARSEKVSGPLDDVKISVLKELHTNVCYAITTSSFLIISSLLVSLVIESNHSQAGCINSYILTPLSIFLMTNVILTVLMIIKRISSLTPKN